MMYRFWRGFLIKTGFFDKKLWDWLELLGALGTFSALAVAVITFSSFRGAQDQQARQGVLQSYIQDMTDLLLGELAASERDSPAREIARALTISAVLQLDGEGKGIVLNFLYDSNLIKNDPIGLLREVDLSNTILSDATMNGAIMRLTNLSRADLHGTSLVNADLSGADLTEANFRDAVLDGADLSRANLRDANLSGADLSRADFRDADVTGADFRDADITGAILGNVNGMTDDQRAQAIIRSETPVPATLVTPVPTRIVATTECFRNYFEKDPEVPKGRVSQVAVGSRDFDIIIPPDEGIFGIKFTDVGKTAVGFESFPIGGIKIFPIPENDIFRVMSVVDATCEEIEEYSNVSRGGKETLVNYDTVEIRFERDLYNLRLGLEEDGIEVNLFERVN